MYDDHLLVYCKVYVISLISEYAIYSPNLKLDPSETTNKISLSLSHPPLMCKLISLYPYWLYRLYRLVKLKVVSTYVVSHETGRANIPELQLSSINIFLYRRNWIIQYYTTSYNCGQTTRPTNCRASSRDCLNSVNRLVPGWSSH